MEQFKSKRLLGLTYEQLILGAAIVTFCMIVIGAITRVSESGMGCGTDWPDCNGRIIPEFQNAATVIEFGHRLFALLVGLFALGVIVQAWRFYRRESRVFFPAVLGFVLYFVQAGLGEATVKSSNQWFTVLLHLGNSMLLLACYLIGWVNVRQLGVAENEQENRQHKSLPLAEVLLTTGFTFVLAMVGAAVAGNYATKACIGWPLCAGQIWPVDQGPLQVLNMVHRLVAGTLGLLLIALLIQAARGGANRTTRNTILAAFLIYLLQAAIGAMVVLVNELGWLTVVRSLHVTFAAATWSVMVIASGSVWLQQSSSKITTRPAERAIASSATTSS